MKFLLIEDFGSGFVLGLHIENSKQYFSKKWFKINEVKQEAIKIANNLNIMAMYNGEVLNEKSN